MKLNWRGPYQDVSGYGSDSRLLFNHLPARVDACLEHLQFGKPVYPLPQTNQHVSDTLVQHCLPYMLRPFKGRSIGRTMYETDRVPADWKPYLSYLDELWVPSSFCQEIFNHPNTKIVPSPIVLNPATPMIERETCRFLFFSEFNKRKNPELLLKAFSLAFTNEPVELYFKTFSFYDSPDELRKKIYPHKLFTMFFTDSELERFYSSFHCLVHPSRGEGFGRTVAEALACGIETISIGETGLKEIQRYPIPAKLVAIPATDYDQMPYSTEGGHHWYEIDIDDLVSALRESYNRWSCKTVRTDRDWVIQNFSGPTITKRMDDLL